ncbi:MAG TPA: hypothetical protein VH877_30095 [Polyangia bacterium]|jgi:hypothetical protein|nr:hypothetical protein [Polyangia bacterium]
MRPTTATLLVLLLPLLLSPGPATAAPPTDVAALEQQSARFAPVDIGADLTAMPAHERHALAELVRAAELLDNLYLRQVWAGNEPLLYDLAADTTPLGRARLHALRINKGPWSRLDQNAPFLPGVPPKPPAANFYPLDATKMEVEQWFTSLAPAEREVAHGFFTTIRRGPDGKLRAVPYSIEYQSELQLAAEHLRRAAKLTQQPSLARFLEKRAAALLSNDYYDSDVAWLELDASIDPTFGPYEVYEDEWFNAKAAFEGYINVRDDAASARLARLGRELQDIEDHLPIEPALRNPKLGGLAPIRVVNVIFSAGQGNDGVQSAAYNLPNDERITRDKGTKRVMLKNNQEAKFNRVLLPIAQKTLVPAALGEVSFDAFFTHILMHELMHGLGPHNISVGGRATTVRAQLEELYSAIEEAKADVSGLYALQRLVDRGVLDKGLERTMYTTFVASIFRSIRFGVTEAHGKANAIELNYLLDQGAVRATPEGRFSIDRAKMKPAIMALTRDLMTLQGHGDRAQAQGLLDRLGVVRPEVQRALDRLADVPVDIEPRFTTAARLRAEFP